MVFLCRESLSGAQICCQLLIYTATYISRHMCSYVATIMSFHIATCTYSSHAIFLFYNIEASRNSGGSGVQPPEAAGFLQFEGSKTA